MDGAEKKSSHCARKERERESKSKGAPSLWRGGEPREACCSASAAGHLQKDREGGSSRAGGKQSKRKPQAYQARKAKE